jgi:hypothetical protein
MVHVYYMTPSLLLAPQGIQSMGMLTRMARSVTFGAMVGLSQGMYSIELTEFGWGFKQRPRLAEVWPSAIRVFIYRLEYMCTL